jgi:hypothetical protein
MRALFQRTVPHQLYGDETTWFYRNFIQLALNIWEGKDVEFRLAGCATFRMFPYGKFDQYEFREQISENVRLQTEVLPFVEGSLDTSVKEAKMIYEEGL